MSDRLYDFSSSNRGNRQWHFDFSSSNRGDRLFDFSSPSNPPDRRFDFSSPSNPPDRRFDFSSPSNPPDMRFDLMSRLGFSRPSYRFDRPVDFSSPGLRRDHTLPMQVCVPGDSSNQVCLKGTIDLKPGRELDPLSGQICKRGENTEFCVGADRDRGLTASVALELGKSPEQTTSSGNSLFSWLWK